MAGFAGPMPNSPRVYGTRIEPERHALKISFEAGFMVVPKSDEIYIIPLRVLGRTAMNLPSKGGNTVPRNHRPHSHALSAALTIAALLVACQNEDPDELINAPSRASVGGSMEAYVSRDFMPSDHAGGSPLMASVKVTASDEKALPEGTDLKRLWVFLDGKVWKTKFADEDHSHATHIIQRMARGGPRWEPGGNIDAVTLVQIPGQRPLFLHVRVTLKATS
jgi:hypothetical protein